MPRPHKKPRSAVSQLAFKAAMRTYFAELGRAGGRRLTPAKRAQLRAAAVSRGKSRRR